MPLATGTPPPPPATGSRAYSTAYPTSTNTTSPTGSSSTGGYLPGVSGGWNTPYGRSDGGPAGAPYSPTNFPGNSQTVNPTAGMGGTGDPYIDGLLSQFNSWAGGQQAQLATNNGLQVGFTNAANDNNIAALTSSYNSDLGRLGQQEYRDVTLGLQGNDISRKYNDLGLGLAGQVYGLAGQKYGLAGEQLGLSAQGRDQGIASAGLNRDIQMRANLSDAASRGAVSTSGYTQNDRDSVDKFGLARDAANLGYAGAELGYKDAGLNYQGAGITYQGAKNSHDQTAANLDLNDAALGSLSKEYGIRQADVKNQFQAGLTKLNLNNAQTIQQLNAALQSGNAQVAQDAYNFMVQVMALPNTSPTSTPSVPTYTPPIGGDVPTATQSVTSSLAGSAGSLINQFTGDAPPTNPISSFFGGLAGNPVYDNNGVTGTLNNLGPTAQGYVGYLASHGYPAIGSPGYQPHPEYFHPNGS